MLGLYPPVQGVTAGPSDIAFQWYWGPNQGAYSQAVFTEFEILYAGVHMAGPNLTPETFKAGMFARPPTGGAPEGKVTTEAGRYYGKNAKLPYDEYQTGGDVTLVWWDPDTSVRRSRRPAPTPPGCGSSSTAASAICGRQLPSKMPAFFDGSKSMYVLPTTPPAEKQPPYPCEGCPSSGGTA